MQVDELKKQLELFKDEKGIIGCRRPLGNSEASYDTKFPVLLSRNHCHTNDHSLLSRTCQAQWFKGNINRSSFWIWYWIPKGTQTAKNKLIGCNICRRFQGRNYPVPESPDLPEFRVRDVPAFSCEGVDFASPLFLKSKVKDEPEMTKVYIALFTCATSQAVHLEPVPSLDALC